MTGPGEVSKASGSPAGSDERLRKTSRQLEGVFVEQLLKVMRQTVPHDGYIDGGAGEDMFTGMLDQHVAESAPAQWKHGLANAVYRQLRPALGGASATASGASPQLAVGKRP